MRHRQHDTKRQRNTGKERQRDRETQAKRDKETERHRPRETTKQIDTCVRGSSGVDLEPHSCVHKSDVTKCYVTHK